MEKDKFKRILENKENKFKGVIIGKTKMTAIGKKKTIKEDLKWLGKKKGTSGYNNVFFVKKYENGAILKRKRGGRIIINSIEAGELLYSLKDISPMKFLSEGELWFVWMKFPETRKFIERMIKEEVTLEELEEIKRIWDLKNEMVDSLEDDKD